MRIVDGNFASGSTSRTPLGMPVGCFHYKNGITKQCALWMVTLQVGISKNTSGHARRLHAMCVHYKKIITI